MEQNTFQVILNQAKKQGKTPFNCQVNLKQTFEMSQKKNKKRIKMLSHSWLEANVQTVLHSLVASCWLRDAELQ